MTTGVRIRKTMLEALLALVLNLVVGGILFATKQTWLLPSQANATALQQLVGGDPRAVDDLGLKGLGVPPSQGVNSVPFPGEQATPEELRRWADKNGAALKAQRQEMQDQITNPPQPSRLLEFLSSSPWISLLGIVLLFPLAEELIFRGLPMLALWLSARSRPPLERANLRRAWVIGVIAAVLFSLAHGIGTPGFHFPLPQFALGLWLWWVATRRGLPFSILAHGTYNLIPGVIVLLAATFQQR